MPEAILTQGESLWIGADASDLSEVEWVVSSPEVGEPPSTVDATSLDSDEVERIPGLKDYSEDLSWELNAQEYSASGSNLEALLALDGTEAALERRMPLAGVKLAFTGIVHMALSGSEPNALHRIALRVTPTSPVTVSAYSEGD